MHPFFSSTNRILALLAGWLLIMLSVCSLLSVTSGQTFLDSLKLFSLPYLLCLIFILPNYYICRALPLGETRVAVLLGSQLFSIVITVSIWVVAGQAYALQLESVTQRIFWVAFFDETLLINVVIVAMLFEGISLLHYLFLALEKAGKLEQAALQQKLLISQAELQALKATVHPHFLFNALNTLSSIALSDPEKAHRLCLLMAEFLRYSVAYSKQNTVTLADELEHVQNYLGVERERFGKRLQTEFTIDQSLRDCNIPPLVLFPLVENAVKHGIDSCLEGGKLSISASAQNNTLLVTISNPVDELGRKRKGEGHGLQSVERRLKNRFGEKALLKTSAASGQFITQIYLPLELSAAAKTVSS